MEEDDGAPPGWSSPPTPKKVKIESEEPKELSKDNDHSEEESKGIEDDDEDGPPPGWQQHPPSPPHPPLLDMIVPPPSSPLPSTPPLPSSPRDLNMEQQESEDEGPPPGWDNKYQPNEQAEELVSPPPISVIPSDIKTEDEKQDSRNEDGPEPRSQAHPSPTRELVPLDIKAEEQDSEDDEPPPGWDSKCLPEPELQTEHPTTPSDLKLEDEQQDAQDDEGPPPGWDSAPQRQSPARPSLPSPMVLSGAKTENEQKNVKVEGERPQPPSRPQSIPPTKPQISAPKPPMAANNLEMGQMVCGSCRRLLSYPRGARYVECACCLEENYVLEEHEVGQVGCGGCNVLLMYPYGAPKVRCVNCSMETEIGDHNRRPPLSEQQRRVRHHPKRVQTS